MSIHWHAYRWIGNGADRGDEGERRPSSPDFPGSHLPPMRTGDWLAKPSSRIADTFQAVADATRWLADEYGKVSAAVPCGDRIPLDDRLADARDLLPRGVDVQWGEWMQGGRFVTLGVICCPNRHVSHACPLR